MKTITINNPDGAAVGNIYFYNRGFYHNSPSGVHGPWKTAEKALAEWVDFYRKDFQYFSIGSEIEGIGDHIINALREQKKRVARHAAAAALGRVKSDRKTSASRENGKSGNAGKGQTYRLQLV
jgi:hypothetical protein